MIDKLRRKFVMINMLLVTLVLIMVFSVILMFNYNRVKDESVMALNRMLERDPAFAPKVESFFQVEGQKQDGPVIMNKPQKPRSFLPVFRFTVDKDGSIKDLVTDNIIVEDKVLSVLRSRLSDAVESGEVKEGVLYDLMLRYKLQPLIKGGIAVAFVDMSREQESMLSLAGTLVLAGTGAILGFLLISLYLSRWALRPVEIAWQQQRQFVADASHELKTPLTVILANMSILKSHRDAIVSEQQSWIDYTQTEAERMKVLIDDLLFLAKSDAEHMPLQKIKVNGSDIAWKTVLPFESVAFEKGVKLSYEIEEGVELEADPGQLKQLIMILLDNACKYAGKGGKATFSLTRSQEGKIFINVSNTGESIPTEEQERIFDRFYRIDESRVRENRGYGLGLAIAKAITDRHDWKINVESTLENGTTFVVRI